MNQKTREMKLTKWEVGQDLIKVADLCSMLKVEMKDQYPELYKMLDDVQRTVGDHFNKLGSHNFGLLDHSHKEKP